MRLSTLALGGAVIFGTIGACTDRTDDNSRLSQWAIAEMERVNVYLPIAEPAPIDARYAPTQHGAETYASSILASAVPPPYDPAFVRAQVLLDRAHFSPGVIDGHPGENVRQAIRSYQIAHGMEVTGEADATLLSALAGADDAPALSPYTISAEDVKGPFAETPDDLEGMAKLSHLGFASAAEAIAEKFHMDEDLLRALNQGADFRQGVEILVANAGGDLAAQVASVEIDKGARQLRAYDARNNLIASYPASIGSEDMPAPAGDFTVEAVAHDPTYHFNAERLPTFGKPNQGPLKIPAGPNSPVGVVWIDLSLDTYGIHGSPDAQLVGKTTSHGCVRLTNWDARELGKAIKNGAVVSFKEPGGTASAADPKQG